MKRISIRLKEEERATLEVLYSSGVQPVRLTQRAQILLALDRGIGD